MPDGHYTLCGEEAQMHGGIVRTAFGGLAGSTLSVDAAVRNMVELTGVTPAEAIHMASLHPARMLGVDGVLGSLNRANAPASLRWIAGCMCNKSDSGSISFVLMVCSFIRPSLPRKAFLSFVLICAAVSDATLMRLIRPTVGERKAG